mgnify:CR=1 FL=1
MELTTICVCIIIWIFLSVVTNVIAFFFSWFDDNGGFFLSLIFTCLCLSVVVTYILLDKGVI